MPESRAFTNLVERPAFAELFLRCPPLDIPASLDRVGLPVFHTNFDLLTTLEDKSLARLKALPLFAKWSRLLRFPTCFAGMTVTEYAPLPANITPEALIAAVLAEHALAQALTIIKDLPQNSPLLSPAENAYADALVAAGKAKGFISVEGQALAYVDIDFADIDEYLGRLSGARRKDLRRKLKKRGQLNVEHLPIGHKRFFDQAFLAELYAMYLEVYEQSEIHFDLLSPEFFAALLQSRDIPGVVILYEQAGTLAGYNLCMSNRDLLIDKFIGFKYPLARELNLYFISWLLNLEYALKHGFAKYITGWTDPEVKASLGAAFSFTRHLVWVKNPLLRRILYPLRHLFESDKQAVDKLT